MAPFADPWEKAGFVSVDDREPLYDSFLTGFGCLL